MKSNAQASARQTLSYVQILERDVRRLRRELEQVSMQLLAARTAAAHLRAALTDQKEPPDVHL